jgi:hypothetical protein
VATTYDACTMIYIKVLQIFKKVEIVTINEVMKAYISDICPFIQYFVIISIIIIIIIIIIIGIGYDSSNFIHEKKAVYFQYF